VTRPGNKQLWLTPLLLPEDLVAPKFSTTRNGVQEPQWQPFQRPPSALEAQHSLAHVPKTQQSVMAAALRQASL
jgi:hypothetical protein